jgi:glycine cleavage system regulatory protein
MKWVNRPGAGLVEAPISAARAEAEADIATLTAAIQRNGCDVAQARMSELERDMQPLAEEIIAAPATSLGGM